MQYLDTRESITRIINSECFQNKEVMKGLLEFLYNAYLKEKTLKEIDIACGFFNRDQAFIPGDDTIVRVNMYKLRKLLQDYYNSEGKTDIPKAGIPKGAYSLVFENSVKETNKTEKGILKLILIIGLILSVLLNIILFISESENYKIDYHPVWQHYNNISKPISIILGNPLFYCDNRFDSTKIIYRNLNINTKEELTAKKLIDVQYPYFSANNVKPLPWIFLALNNNNPTELQALTEVNADHIKNNNQIFIANINSFGIYNTFLEQTSIRINTNPRQILLCKDSDTIIYTVAEKHDDYHDDYALFVKIPGANGNIITIMGDFHASGNAGVANMLMDSEKMKEFNNYVLNKYERFPRYFEMIVKVSSYQNTELKTSILYFNKIDHQSIHAIYFPEMMN